MTITDPRPDPGPTIKDQAAGLLTDIAGYIGHRVISMGLRRGLVQALDEAGPDGLSAGDLAEQLGFDELYTAVWLRGALGAGICERHGDRYRLTNYTATLLLDAGSPAYVGGMYAVTEADEMFARFERNLSSGERMWWSDCDPTWIAAVAATGTPFYTRLVPGGLSQVPGVEAALEGGGRVVDHACGSGNGVIRLAEAYPRCRVVGTDGDRHSIEVARRKVRDAGVADRVELVCSPLEELQLDEPVDVVVNNISMHECRDIDAATDAVIRALAPGGRFVISDFPFPDSDEGLRSVPGRLMGGIQFFEAQIDDQLLPRAFYDGLLSRHGFVELGSVEISPVHALTYGRRPS